MELRHLRYFVAVAEELNFTHAASRLRVAQPALSSQIKDLESELQVTLFQRGHGGVQLTAAGKAFYRQARAILAQTNQAANAARTAAGAFSGSLTLGFLSGIHLNHLAPLVRAFRKTYPQVQLDYFHGNQAQQLKAVHDGRIDIAYVTLPHAADDLDTQLIWRVPFKVVLPQGHPLAKQRTFELGDLRAEDFVFCSRESRPDFYDEFFRQCANAGFRPRVLKEVGGYPTNMLGLISMGLGVSVLPHFEQVERIKGIVWRPLTKPRLWWDFALAWRRPVASRIVEHFLAAAEREFPVAPESDQAEM